ncbi:MAG TPA: RagB/SusD family nutrient uptake outer membrane protein, partial [Longimicrobiales bacterium]|nr:RagB/SusD family nutrient uptake outer membrane protein [Longimicrobiales bacterium]
MINNRLRTAALSLALIAAAGCQDLNEVPVDFVAPENFYKTGTDAIAAVNSAYASFVTPGNGISSSNYLGRNFWMLLEYQTDYATSRLSATNERSLMGTFSPLFTPSHVYIEGYWQAAYSGINKANAVIANVATIPTSATFTEARKNQVIAEAKFLRALHYYWLAGAFGGVPLKLEPTTTIEGGALARASDVETWAQIAKDLSEAAAVLPASWPSSDFGRVTKGAALTLLAKSYLQSAATVPSLKAANYQKALDTFKQVTGYSLDPNYASLFNGTNEQSKEIIWSIQNIRVEGYGGRITQWYTPITSPQVFTPGGQNQFQAERPFYESYGATDVRRDGTWFTTLPRTDGRTITWAWATNVNLPANYGSTGPVPRKYVDLAAASNDGAEGIDYVILRYADVLLGMAEAINEITGPTAEAIGYVNQVRTRAGIPALPAASTASQAAFRDAISNEREWEFAMEGVYGFYDMRRNWTWAKNRVESNMRLARTAPGGGTDINRTAPNTSFNSNVEKCTAGNGPVCYTPITDK